MNKSFEAQIAAKQAASKQKSEQTRILQKTDTENVHFELNAIRKHSRYFKITHLRLYSLNGLETILLPPNTARILDEAGHDICVLSNGGLTTIESVDNKGVKCVGVARCHINDGFSRAEGRKYALKNYLYNLP